VYAYQVISFSITIKCEVTINTVTLLQSNNESVAV